MNCMEIVYTRFERVDCTSEWWMSEMGRGNDKKIKKINKINEWRDTDEYNERADNERGR